MTRNVDILTQSTEIDKIVNNLDKSFSERRKARRRDKLIKNGDGGAVTETIMCDEKDENKERERFRKMGYGRRMKYLANDVDEVKQTTCENRKYIRDIYSRLDLLVDEKQQKIKFSAQLLQRSLLEFLTYGEKEGYIIVENGKFTRIEK